MSDKDKINKLYWDTYNDYTIGRGDPIKGHELAMEVIEKAIYNQALEDAANMARREAGGQYADPDAEEWLRGHKAGCRHIAEKIEELKSN